MVDAYVDTIFSKGGCRFDLGAMVLFKGVRFGTLYKLDMITQVMGMGKVKSMEKVKLMTTLKTQNMMLWHCQMGHLSEKNLKELCNKNIFHGIDDFKDTIDFYEACVLKMKERFQFSLSNNKSQEVLELVHFDICGAMDVVSIGGSHYFITSIDDISQKSCLLQEEENRCP
jgi:hypothetical protein